MSTMHSDPLFVRAEVAYRLERFGVGGAGPRADAWPSLAAPWRRWALRHHRTRPLEPADACPRGGGTPTPVTGAMIGAVPPLSRPDLVGRDDEVARLTEALGWTGAGGAVLLGGDAGIGKTALVGRLVDAASDRRVLVGHCVGEVGASLPYLPFVEMLAALDARERDLVDDLVAAHPGLVPLVPRIGAGSRSDTDRAGLVEAVHGALAALGRLGPLLVVVEDVHWADESTRELLTLLFTRSRPEGVGLLVTWRSDDVHRRHPLSGTLAVWSRLPGLARLDLGPLSEDVLRRIVRRARPDLPSRSVEEAARRAEGNAFFAEELAAAAGTGRVDPGDLSRLLVARVDRLDDAAQGLVRVASVIGRRVPHALLERVADVDAATLRAGLRTAVEHHVLEPWGDRGYAFRHALLAEAVSDDLLPAERLQLHRACAEALRDDPGARHRRRPRPSRARLGRPRHRLPGLGRGGRPGPPDGRPGGGPHPLRERPGAGGG